MTETNRPLVSFVVPCYNYGRFLGECLESILCQEGYSNYEIIVIDDASTDNTSQVLGSFGDSRLRVISHHKNRGHVATITEGIRQARGRFVARMDPDDRYRKSFLTTVLEKLIAHPEVGLVYGDVAIIDELGSVTAERCDRLHGGQDYKGYEFIRLLEANYINSATVIARREAWLGALPVPEGLAFNDWYFTLTMSRRYEFYYVDKVLADYRVHGENHHRKVTRDRSNEQSVLWLLEKVFSETEDIAELERAKRKNRRRVFASQYQRLAQKYFSCEMDSDARRCYLEAVKLAPKWILDRRVIGPLVATYIGRRAYARSKSFIAPLTSGSSRHALE